MGAIFTPSRRIVQPSAELRVDWSNPITRGLVGLLWCGPGGARELFNGFVPVVTNAVQAAAAQGSVYRVATAGTNGVYSARIGAPNWVLPSAAVSYFCFADITWNGASSANVAGYQGNSNKGYNLVDYYATRVARVYAGATYADSGTGNWSTGAQVRGLTYDGAYVRCYDQGIASGTPTALTGTIGYDTTYGRVKLLGSADYSGRAGDGYWAAVWTRALSPCETAQLAQSPWSLFAPLRSRRIFSAPGAGGGPTYTLAASPLALTLTGNAVTLKAAHKIVASPLALTLTGNAVALKAAHKIVASPLALTLTGNAVALKAAHKIVASPLALTLTGNAVALKAAHKIVASPLALTLTGSAVTLKAAHKIAASPLALTLTGNAVTLTYVPAGALLYDTPQAVDGFAVNSLAVNGGLSSYSMYVAPMALTLAGNAVTLKASHKLAVSPMALTLTGNAVALKAAHKIAVSPMALTLTGNDVTLTKGGKRITVDTMALTLAGNAVGLRAAHRLAVSPMALTLTLNDVIPLVYGLAQGYDKQFLCPATPLTKDVQDAQWRGWFLNLRRAAAHGAGLPGVRAFTLGTREISYGDILPATSVGDVVTGVATSGGYGAPTADEYNALVAQVAALRAALIAAGIAIT